MSHILSRHRSHNQDSPLPPKPHGNVSFGSPGWVSFSEGVLYLYIRDFSNCWQKNSKKGEDTSILETVYPPQVKFLGFLLLPISLWHVNYFIGTNR